MWRDDRLYDLIVVLGFNDDPPAAGAGSAIFLHVARPDFAPTQGCVALSEAALHITLRALKPQSHIEIRGSSIGDNSTSFEG
jgi:L,D-peptidoglycan transpeptidase YkuD (ErfK/YbiS/YcfS/YnhG family)